MEARLCAAVLLLSMTLAGCDERPDAPPALPAKSPEVLDREALQDLVDSGGDPGAVHTLRHVIFFPSVDTAQKAASALQVAGYRTSVKRSRSAPPNRQFLVHAETRAVPTLEYLQRTRESLGNATAKLGGLYDGWELVLAPAASAADAGSGQTPDAGETDAGR